jgi:hypothetical protein
LEPPPELAYVIGGRIGDGYAVERRHVRRDRSYSDFVIGLRVKDKEFAEETARCLATVLGRESIKPWVDRSQEDMSSKLHLGRFTSSLKTPLTSID